MKTFSFWPINLLWIEHFLPDLAEILCVTSLCIHLRCAGKIPFLKNYLTWFFILFFICSEIWENCCNSISQRYRCINNSFCDPNLLQKLRMTPLQYYNKFMSTLMQISSIFSQAEMVKKDMTNFLFAVESCFLLVFCCFYHIWWLLKVKESRLSVYSCCVWSIKHTGAGQMS